MVERIWGILPGKRIHLLYDLGKLAYQDLPP